MKELNIEKKQWILEENQDSNEFIIEIILNRTWHPEAMLKHITDVFTHNIFKTFVCQEILFFKISKEIIDLGQAWYVKEHVNDSLKWTNIKWPNKKMSKIMATTIKMSPFDYLFFKMSNKRQLEFSQNRHLSLFLLAIWRMSTYYSWMLLALSCCLHGDALCTLEFLGKVHTSVA